MTSSSSNFGQLVLVLGDLHIPHRASQIPPPFQRMLVPGRMQHVLCTGNVGSAAVFQKELQSLAPNVHCVPGDWDEETQHWPDTHVIQVGDFKIGLAKTIVPWDSPHAWQRMRRKLQVDVLVSRGGPEQTKNQVQIMPDGTCWINPVSVVALDMKG